MHIFPVILDFRPEYLGGEAEPHSLLSAPLGTGRVQDRLHAFLDGLTLEPLAVLTTPEARRMRLGEAPLGFAALIEHGLTGKTVREPNDYVLLLDARFLPIDDMRLTDCLEVRRPGPMTQHLVVLENPAPGAVELVRRDAEGRVARIGRYYEGVTYVRATGVAAAVVPVSMLHWMRDAPLRSLADLRAKMAVAGLPARDVAAPRGVVSVADLPHFLEVSERATRAACNVAHDHPEFIRRGEQALVHRDAIVSPAARLMGAIVVHSRARIEAGVTIVGPATIGAGALLERDASVAHGVVMPQTVVPAGHAVVHGVYGGPQPALPDQPAHPSDIDDARAFVRARARQQTLRTAAIDSPLPAPNRGYLLFKEMLERTLAIVGLLVLSPLLLLIAALIKLESRGGALFGHVREGRGGQPFKCWKFRTMVSGADQMQRELRAQARNEVDGPQFKLTNDPRTTRLGRFLRRTNIDEIPQLLNVALGQMSLIGPRPSPFGENQICVPWRQSRLSVRPGITGLWQICRGDRESDFHEWIYYDMLYVQHMSPWVDTKIFLATLLTCGGKWSVPLSSIVPEERLRSEIVRGLAAAEGPAPPPDDVTPATARAAAARDAEGVSPDGSRWAIFGGLLAVLLWSFWPTIQELIAFWSTNEDYSVGALVPLIVAYFAWRQRDGLRGAVGAPAVSGLGLLVAAQGLRGAALYYDYASLERVSLVASFAGLVWMAFGTRLARKTLWLTAFLLLMAPPPQRVHEAVSVPLQEFAAISAVFSLELMGIWVQRAGNVLEIDGRTHVAVAEACSGLRMLAAFVVVAATFALLVRRPGWQRALLVASSIPIAVACNSIRLAATVLLYHWVSSDVAERFFHDFAGLVMMPLAVLLMWGELALLQWMFPAAEGGRTRSGARSEAVGEPA